MRVYEVQRSQLIHRPIDEVFPFFAAAANLEAITPPWLRFRMITPEPIDMHLGTVIEYRLRVHGVPIRWKSRIDEWEPGQHFLDRQLRGPYRLWEHLHVLEPHPEGTVSRDRVRYALPLGPLGTVANALLVRRDLQRIFDYRREATLRLLG